MTLPGRVNNFDLIRLFAAVQVFIFHAQTQISFFESSVVQSILSYFPGVPIFLTISGFLIFWSFDRSPNLKFYFKNRILRIYPALWICMILTTILLLSFCALSWSQLFSSSYILYFFSRCSFLFIFSPSVVQFGVGNPNPVFWTIGLELQFYLVLPIIYWIIKGKALWLKNLILVVLAIFSYLCNQGLVPFFNFSEFNGYIQILLNEIKIHEFLFFFIGGMLLYLNFSYLNRFIKGKFIFYLVSYALYNFVLSQYTNNTFSSYSPNLYGLFGYIILMFAIVSGAYSKTEISNKILKGNDYSYGIYIFHMLVMNSVSQLNLFSGIVNLIISVIVTGILAYLSWNFVEKKALSLKQYSIRDKLFTK